jgi:hypothetical protein
MTSRLLRSRKTQKVILILKCVEDAMNLKLQVGRQERSRPAAEIKKHKATISNHDQKKFEPMQT